MILKNIRSLCKEKGVTIQSVEREAGLSNGLISKWGSVSPSVDKLKAVADVLGVSVDFLLADHEPLEEAATSAP